MYKLIAKEISEKLGTTYKIKDSPINNGKIKRSELSPLKMVAGNEQFFTTVISKDCKYDWIGFGWILANPPTKSDYKKFPIVEG